MEIHSLTNDYCVAYLQNKLASQSRRRMHQLIADAVLYRLLIPNTVLLEQLIKDDAPKTFTCCILFSPKPLSEPETVESLILTKVSDSALELSTDNTKCLSQIDWIESLRFFYKKYKNPAQSQRAAVILANMFSSPSLEPAVRHLAGEALQEIISREPQSAYQKLYENSGPTILQALECMSYGNEVDPKLYDAELAPCSLRHAPIRIEKLWMLATRIFCSHISGKFDRLTDDIMMRAIAATKTAFSSQQNYPEALCDKAAIQHLGLTLCDTYTNIATPLCKKVQRHDDGTFLKNITPQMEEIIISMRNPTILKDIIRLTQTLCNEKRGSSDIQGMAKKVLSQMQRTFPHLCKSVINGNSECLIL